MHQWDISKFPFDEQQLLIQLEDAKYDASQVIYIADSANSKVDCSFNSKEWTIKSFKIKADKRTYKTTYGNPELSGSSSYPQLTDRALALFWNLKNVRPEPLLMRC